MKNVTIKATETSGRFNADSYLQFFQQLFQKFEGNIIHTEDPDHRASSLTSFKDENKEPFPRVPFPTFSPDLNPIEKLWKIAEETKRIENKYKLLRS